MASSPEHPELEGLEKGSEIFYNDPNLVYTELFAWIKNVLIPNDSGFSAMVDKYASQREELLSHYAIHFFPVPEKRVHKKQAAPKPVAKRPKLTLATSLNTNDPLWKSIASQVKEVASLRSQVSGVALANAKKISHLASREIRRTQIATLAISDPVGTARKAMKEVLAFWRKNEREEKELRRRAERLAAEQRRAEEEAREARRQARKLDFLINQTELYAHFMARKLGTSATPTNAPTTANVTITHPVVPASTVSAPGMLHCILKPYQLRGLSWLASLYDQGINGILADEMGLGKTVQSIALLAHLSERHGIHGPFLVVTPASTLHNWMDELGRFVPGFVALPYWGPDRRSLLKGSNFNVLVTSYQIVVSDERILSRIDWQYMVLDEAQAIKSSSSVRWRTLLGIPARNRLLLTGTPIQNTMAELWALLHFIMPGLFDSHEEFASWFSKDIEEDAGKGGSNPGGFGGSNPHQLRRLHAILRPFMLRRLKREVEMELADKMEIDLVVPPSPLQRRLIGELRASISLSSAFSALKNAVMQARKLCNHPELLLAVETEEPLLFQAPALVLLPRLITEPIENIFSLRIRNLSLLDDLRIQTEQSQSIRVELMLPRLVRTQHLCTMPAVAPLPSLSVSTAGGYVSGAFRVSSAIGPHIPTLADRIESSGKMGALISLLNRLKTEGHRVLIYFQMTRMMDIAEEILVSLSFSLLRLDGTCRIEDRRDMVHAWQNDSSLFLFLLSTRAGGLGINLTAADTVIFYDSDWNPTVDQQAMDRAHRLGQTKQVVVYRLITAGTIEERIQQRARKKHAIQKAVIEAESNLETQPEESVQEIEEEGSLGSELPPEELAELLL